MRVLVIEDNPRLSEALVRGLAEQGFDVSAASTGASGLLRLLEHPVEAAIVDLGLPDRDGLTVVREARAARVVAPIMILTARDTVQSCIEGLEAGADDYMIKPFAYQELVARVRALIRRSSLPRAAPEPFVDITLADKDLCVRVRGRAVLLSPRERGLLALMLQRRGQVVSRREILRQVFGYDFETGTNIVEVHIAHLRRKLGEEAALIRTVRGAGYFLALPHATD